jgi:HK97 gp10 family phage protein
MAYGQQVRITGLNETIRSLRKAGVEGTELKEAMAEGSQVLADSLRKETPIDTGTIASTVRPARQQRKALARQGGRRPRHYAPFPNFGTKYQPAQEFAARAVKNVRVKAIALIGRNLNKIIDRNGLK